jgi:hypothetical protein
MGGACSAYERVGGVYTGLSLGKTEGKRQIGRPTRRWKANSKIFRKWVVVTWTGINLAQDRSGVGLL